MANYGASSPQGLANMRRARETLRPGDIIWYPTVSRPLMVVIEVGPRILVRHLYPFHGEEDYLFHGDWELLGHEPSLLTMHEVLDG